MVSESQSAPKNCFGGFCSFEGSNFLVLEYLNSIKIIQFETSKRASKYYYNSFCLNLKKIIVQNDETYGTEVCGNLRSHFTKNVQN